MPFSVFRVHFGGGVFSGVCVCVFLSSPALCVLRVGRGRAQGTERAYNCPNMAAAETLLHHTTASA